MLFILKIIFNFKADQAITFLKESAEQLGCKEDKPLAKVDKECLREKTPEEIHDATWGTELVLHKGIKFGPYLLDILSLTLRTLVTICPAAKIDSNG